MKNLDAPRRAQDSSVCEFPVLLISMAGHSSPKARETEMVGIFSATAEGHWPDEMFYFRKQKRTDPTCFSLGAANIGTFSHYSRAINRKGIRFGRQVS
ncbi:hypothetical protein CDAR_286631 [Caerostris darwini]|uniref:Uncharacterized protein n=1 Tax=Caerostris darwini TaxID=1538125 RepID=A0AAV4UTN8_9ARAC|nr:hypothetical protein CDAR_286631 [Caerostris darwini]